MALGGASQRIYSAYTTGRPRMQADDAKPPHFAADVSLPERQPHAPSLTTLRRKIRSTDIKNVSEGSTHSLSGSASSACPTP